MNELIVEVVLEYKNRRYTFDFNFEHDFDDKGNRIMDKPYPLESAIYMFEEGNYSCDCNKSIFIRQYCDKDFPDMPCGDDIKLVSLIEKP